MPMPASDRTSKRRPRRERSARVRRIDLPHGVAAGDVTDDSAVVWTRTDGPAVVHVEYATDESFGGAERVDPRPTEATTDHTVKFRLDDLAPGTAYHYRVWALSGRGAERSPDAPGDATTGRFHTAPAPDADDAVSFVWTGDTYGQGRAPPYQVPRRMADLAPDFFLYLGDTIYADDGTPALPDGDPETVEDYRAKYREVRELGTNLRAFLRDTSVVTIWDDHEVRNDWAGSAEPLLPAARQAFLEYWPVDEHPSLTGEDGGRLYRSFRWGEAVELFVLDARQYRDENAKPDGPDKTMLGEEQREWLKEGLAATDATFAVVASSISLSSPSSAPDARDSWASGDSETGFEHELLEIVEFVRTEVESTVVWLAGDRHFARIASFDVDRDGTPETYEAIASPIGAAPRAPGEPDRTLDPTVHYQEGGKYELGEFYNFGHIEATTDALRIGIHDKVGDRRCAVTIDADGDGWPSVEPSDPRRDGPSILNLLKNPFDALSDR